MKTPAPAFERSYLCAKWGSKGVSAVKNSVSTATTTLTSTSKRRMPTKLSALSFGTVPLDEHRDDAHEPRRDRASGLTGNVRRLPGPRSRCARVHARPCQGCQPCLRAIAASGLVLATQEAGSVTGQATSDLTGNVRRPGHSFVTLF